MKTVHVSVKFPHGLHARPASRLIRLIRRFRSRIDLKCGTKLANGRSILSILLLAAACNAELDILASGEDEEDAIQAVESFFQQNEAQDAAVNAPEAGFPAPKSPPAE